MKKTTLGVIFLGLVISSTSMAGYFDYSIIDNLPSDTLGVVDNGQPFGSYINDYGNDFGYVSGPASLNGSYNTLRAVSGSFSINGNYNVVTTDYSLSLSVQGDQNRVQVVTGNVQVNGNYNTVSEVCGNISIKGSNNTVSAGGADLVVKICGDGYYVNASGNYGCRP